MLINKEIMRVYQLHCGLTWMWNLQLGIVETMSAVTIA